MNNKLERILPLVEKPARYTGGEYNMVQKDKQNIDLRVAFCFPDTYEIGMSYLGLRILYGLLNQISGVWCERAFAPWVDMERQMRENDIPLYALESGDPLSEFDMLAFTLQYELSYTNLLNMLDMSGLPLHAKDRDSGYPLVIAGGPCAYNPEPLADFVDIFILGEGEEVLTELTQLVRQSKNSGDDRQEMLKKAAQLQGVYVPSFYHVDYHADGTLAHVTADENMPAKVKKRIIQDLDGLFFPTDIIVPSTEIVHDRAVLEIFRGCIRGCRFCHAGFVNRPVRAKSPEVLKRQAIALCESTGYDEISLLSLSTSDYKRLFELSDSLIDWCEPRSISLSLPSLRADNFSVELLQKVQKVRKSGLTFAPEAGSQRLRDVINKNVKEEDVLNACSIAFKGGWSTVKLYFMLGLPTETDEDIRGIGDMAEHIYQAARTTGGKRAPRISVSAAGFVPKPMTPFQWEAQATMEEFEAKQAVAREGLRKNISFSWHDARTSFLEGILARGDRRLGRAIEAAWKMGCRLDGWGECFDLDKWLAALKQCGLDPAFYANRERGKDEMLPWDHLDAGVPRAYLWKERGKAYRAEITPDCGNSCAGCGANALLDGGVCGD